MTQQHTPHADHINRNQTRDGRVYTVTVVGRRRGEGTLQTRNPETLHYTTLLAVAQISTQFKPGGIALAERSGR